MLRDRYSGGVRTQRLYAQQDANDDTTALVDTTGKVQERYVYSPYGVVTVLDASGNPRAGNASAFGWQYLFQGGRQDPVTGWYHFQNRDLIPAEGQWAEKDPMGFAAGDLNLYRFVENDPSSYTDPSGLSDQGGAGVNLTGGDQYVVNDTCSSSDGSVVARPASRSGPGSAGRPRRSAGPRSSWRATFAVVTAETGVGVIGGGIVAFEGLDNLGTGLSKLSTGQPADTLTYQATLNATGNATVARCRRHGSQLGGYLQRGRPGGDESGNGQFRCSSKCCTRRNPIRNGGRCFFDQRIQSHACKWSA